MTVIGVHLGLQNTSMAELRELWRDIEEMGYGWISIWDHFYAAPPIDPTCFEAVASHAAVAMTTTKVRCGSLVYCVGYRHPAVLANAIATIDHLSGGRADLGLGSGWSEVEYKAYGIPFPSVGDRMDILEEAAECVRSLLRNESTTFEGRYFTMTDARCEPRPVQAELPLWIGGGGEKRTLRIAARFADGWNVPYISPEEFARKSEVLSEHCVAVGRDPNEVRRTINVALAKDGDELARHWGAMADFIRPGAIVGGPDQLVEGVGRYVEAGAAQVNVALRAPFDRDGLERLAAALDLAG